MKSIIDVLIYMGLMAIGFYIVYMLIKTAVKHAIIENSDMLQKIITNAIKESKPRENKEDE